MSQSFKSILTRGKKKTRASLVSKKWPDKAHDLDLAPCR